MFSFFGKCGKFMMDYSFCLYEPGREGGSHVYFCRGYYDQPGKDVSGRFATRESFFLKQAYYLHIVVIPV